MRADLVDLSDDASFANGFPHETFTWLREHAPVFWHEPTPVTPDGEGFWVVSRHADVLTVQRDDARFSSDRGGVRERGGTAIKDEPSAGHMLNMTDGDAHRRLRALVSRGFTPKAVSTLETDLRDLTARLLDAAGDRAFDAVAGFAREIPSQAICLVLGVPEGDRPELLDHLDAGLAAESSSIISKEASTYIRTYASQLIEEKRRDPDGGIMSTIVNAELDDGSQLTDRELISFFALLFPAGSETTRGAIAGALAAFARFPEQFERLVADPDLIPLAVEEVVRWTTPSVYKRRTAAVDVELAGVTMSRGDKVTFWEMSANRDERAFDEPFTFDVGRDPNPHLGFGWGVHHCLGVGLARQEIRIALEEVVARYRSFEIVGEEEWMPNNRLLGLRRLGIRGELA